MHAGRLDRRLKIQRITRTRDAVGSHVESISDLMTVWAGKVEVGGRELMRGGQLVTEVDAIFTIRWPSLPIDTSMRVVESGTTYEIIKLSEITKQEGIEILAKAAKPKVSMGGAA